MDGKAPFPVLVIVALLLLGAIVAPMVAGQSSGGGNNSSSSNSSGNASGGPIIRLGLDGNEAGGADFFTNPNGTGDLHNPPIYLPAGATVNITFKVASGGHDLHIGPPIDQKTDVKGQGAVQYLQFTVPANAPANFSYWCDPHKSLGMEGPVFTTYEGYTAALTKAAAGSGGGGGGAPDISSLGVNYYAYWVGVIAFMALIIVYGSSFFLFKYGESPLTRDHKDRSGQPKGEEASAARRRGLIYAAAVLIVVLLIFAWTQGMLHL